MTYRSPVGEEGEEKGAQVTPQACWWRARTFSGADPVGWGCGHQSPGSCLVLHLAAAYSSSWLWPCCSLLSQSTFAKRQEGGLGEWGTLVFLKSKETRIHYKPSSTLRSFKSFFFLIFWLHLWHVEVPWVRDQTCSNESHSGDNARSLTHWVMRGLLSSLYLPHTYIA